MSALPRRALLAAPAALLMFALVACGGGSDSDSGGSRATDTRQSAHSGGDAQAAGEEAGEEKETPLTGEIKQKAEAAALAKYPGTVLKSENDTEKPGMYAVEIKKSDGTTVEVYLDKSYTVSGTKQEGAEDNEG